MHHGYFWSTYAITFLAELPDKTAFAVLIIATRSNPFLAFAGAALAFALQCLISVAGGSLLSLLPHEVIRVGSGVLFLAFAVVMGVRRKPEKEEPPGTTPEVKGIRTVWVSFVVVFLAEWGDLTQISTALLAAKHKTPILVFSAATLALWSVAALAILIGNRARTILRPAVLRGTAAGALAVVGIALLVGIPWK